jgi:hypothetical protein
MANSEIESRSGIRAGVGGEVSQVGTSTTTHRPTHRPPSYNATQRFDCYARWPRVRTYSILLVSSSYSGFSQSHATSACSRSSKKERRASATDRVRMASRTATISSCLTGMALSSVQDTYVLSLPRIHPLNPHTHTAIFVVSLSVVTV